MEIKNNLPDRPVSGVAKILRFIVRFTRKVIIKTKLRGKIKWGNDVRFGKQLDLRPPEFITIGDHVSIGPWFLTEVNVQIGSDVLISSKVSFVGNDHSFDASDKTIFFSGRLPPSTVILEGDNLIGFGTIIIGNVRIGKGCIVGAGSVVTKDLPGYHICSGVPAKPLMKRYSTLHES